MTAAAAGALATSKLRRRLNAAEATLSILRNLRRFAKGRPCQFRIPGVCNGNPETSVWVHVSHGAGISGMGQKAPDICGGIACSACHDVIDGRVLHLPNPATESSIALTILHGVLRSQALVWKEAGL